MISSAAGSSPARPLAALRADFAAVPAWPKTAYGGRDATPASRGGPASHTDRAAPNDPRSPSSSDSALFLPPTPPFFSDRAMEFVLVVPRRDLFAASAPQGFVPFAEERAWTEFE